MALYTDIYQSMASYGTAVSPLLKAEERQLGCSMAFYTDSRVEPMRVKQRAMWCLHTAQTASTLLAKQPQFLLCERVERRPSANQTLAPDT